jgi:hypothetical protein
MWWVTTLKSGLNAVNFKNCLALAVIIPPGPAAKAKTLHNSQNREKLSGRIEVDGFFVGGKKPGKRDRGADGKTIVLVAIERSNIQDPETFK